jgi:hypothetical protein
MQNHFDVSIFMRVISTDWCNNIHVIIIVIATLEGPFFASL